jgi:hypothetical protein
LPVVRHAEPFAPAVQAVRLVEVHWWQVLVVVSQIRPLPQSESAAHCTHLCGVTTVSHTLSGAAQSLLALQI